MGESLPPRCEAYEFVEKAIAGRRHGCYTVKKREGEMARYKHTDAADGQGLFLSVNLKEQLLPGTFEYMLNDLIDSKIDIGIFDGNYKNDKTGAKAIPPPALIKLVIYGYSKGKKSSRGVRKMSRGQYHSESINRNP